DLISANRDMTLKIEVETYVRLARYAPGRIEFTPANGAPRDLAARLGQRLQAWTGVRWGVSIVPGCETLTINEELEADARAVIAGATEPSALLQAVLAAFPDSKVKVNAAESEAAEAALAEVEDEWDPFEED